MWHEARRQERKIRGMLVDYRKRAERRRDFYEKIKADPTQFLQVHGRQCKIHLDPNVAAAADSAVMMPWQGQQDNLIDRFDVRAHLDYIPAVKKEEESEPSQEERQLNYERYRIIAQNSFLGITEEKFLKQLHLEEQFGYTESKAKREQKIGGVAIGFNYEDGTGGTNYPQEQEEESDDNSDSDLDVDLAINVSKMDPAQAHDMNKHGRNFGMSSNDFYSFLTNDMEEAESYKLAKEEEQEKALFSGRRSRRERRYHREKRLANRKISPPSYAAQASPTIPQLRASKSPSRSPTPDNTGKITYITSFGDDEEPALNSKPSYADKVKLGKTKSSSSSKREASSERTVYKKSNRSQSKDRLNSTKRRFARSRSGSRKRSNSRTRRSTSRPRGKRSKSTSKTRGRRSKSRSRSRSRRTRSLSRSRMSGSKLKRTRSRSKSSFMSNSRKSRSRSKSRYTKPLRRKRSSSSSSSTCSSSSSSSEEKQPLNSSTDLTRPSSKSPEKNKSPSPPVKDFEPAPKVITRYYGRKRSDDSSSESSEEDNIEDVEMKPAPYPDSSDSKNGIGNSTGSAIKKSCIVTPSAITIAERLKRKRQAQLNRQFKADKIAEQLKTEREKQEQQTREDELREMAIRLRRRQREIRHAYESRSSSSSDSDGSRRSSKDSDAKRKSSKERNKEGDENRKRDRRDRKSSGERRAKSKDRGDRRERDRKDRDNDRTKDLDRNKDADRSRDRDRDRNRARDNRRDDDRRDKRNSNSPQRLVFMSRRREDTTDKNEDGRSGRALVDY